MATQKKCSASVGLHPLNPLTGDSAPGPAGAQSPDPHYRLSLSALYMDLHGPLISTPRVDRQIIWLKLKKERNI